MLLVTLGITVDFGSDAGGAEPSGGEVALGAWTRLFARFVEVDLKTLGRLVGGIGDEFGAPDGHEIVQ